ncbi:MAG: hypothetical protein A2W59_00385 [Candidatus Terrybacteria bacterium RIFCSPHIGHO2_02_41_19]|uniref:Uncharacterized protein n=1 Tax=Candidatus Terrybacteria bacterium RIFCSPHIGHO2_02_41_19 TaxID=1802364 RepID=A0A1G2PLI5_9BACT|nr:MAG: hypothetical protein A2W59_00385 [Candidatus Terrybacteria bacterium RIFCSPHIGHO2_02_41_19]
MSCEIFKSDVVVAYADFYFLNNYVKIIVNENNKYYYYAERSIIGGLSVPAGIVTVNNNCNATIVYSDKKPSLTISRCINWRTYIDFLFLKYAKIKKAQKIRYR